MTKINALSGDLVLNNNNKYLHSVFSKNGIPFVKQKIATIPDVFSKSLDYQDIDILILDPNHWYYSDACFTDYIKSIISNFEGTIFFGDFLWTWNYPEKYSKKHFYKNLIKRTNIVSETINQSITFISPMIEIFREEQRRDILDYFRETSHHFDGYSVSCEFDFIQEKEVAKLTSFLNDIMKYKKIPLWVTRWSIPIAENAVLSSIIEKPPIVPIKSTIASRKIGDFFHMIDNISDKQSRWFLSGVGQDSYDNEKDPIDCCYWLFSPHSIDDWGLRNFDGLIDFKGQIKVNVVGSICSLANSNEII